jgi:O-Antigen ligase
MRRAVPAAAAACLLISPTALAFWSGGYYSEPRLLAALVVWALVLALAITGPAPVPRSRAGALAVGGLVLMTAWSALSVTWAPLGGPAIESVQRLVLYVGALLLAIGALRAASALRAVEPALAGGATLVIAYGLSGRLLPGIVHLAHSHSAGGRLEQPITYWNGEGALAAVALVLCARIAGDRTRSGTLRAAAGAAVAPLAAGVYLSFSRGAIAVGVLGLVLLVAADPARTQVRACIVAFATSVAAALSVAFLPGVASLAGDHRTRDGLAALALLVLVAATAAFVTARGRPEAQREQPRWARHRGPLAAAAVGTVALGLVIGGLGERPGGAELTVGANASRLTTVSSNRYEYWRVGLRAFAREPITGLGAAGFRVEWLRKRTFREAVRDVHSIEVEMAAELGLVGLLAFGLLLAGVGMAGARALRRHPVVAAGPCAALLTWLLHASIDWDWQLPAVSLPAVILAGALISVAELDAAR